MVLKKCSNNVHKIVFTNKYFYQKYKKIINIKKIKYIPVGFYKDINEVKKLKKIKFKKNTINIGYFGPLRDYKGIKVYNESISLFNNEVVKSQICFHYITYELGTPKEHKKNLELIKKLSFYNKNIKIKTYS